MKKIKTYKIFEISEYHSDSLKLDIQEYINDLHLEDDDLKMSFILYVSPKNDIKINFYINSIYKENFKLIDVKDEIFRLNNFMDSFQFSVDSIRYRNSRHYHRQSKYWANLYDTKQNRWGVRQDINKIFDIQDCDVESLETDSVEIVMIDNEYRKI
jgi:hypothetical protein